MLKAVRTCVLNSGYSSSIRLWIANTQLVRSFSGSACGTEPGDIHRHEISNAGSITIDRTIGESASSGPVPILNIHETANTAETRSTHHDIHLDLNLDKPRGVFREKEIDDIQILVHNFTSPALAGALRDRETTLQRAAALLFSNELTELKELLNPFLDSNVAKRRRKKHNLDLTNGFSRKEIVLLQRYIHRMPRHVFHAAERRASVVIPLCNVNGVASILFERRSLKVRTHKQQVCFPGGMLDEGVDNTIIQTSLREMEEELGIPREKIEVLGILRCNWNEVASMTGIAVTPVIGFIGELTDLVLTPNSDEVEQYFTISIEDLLDEQKWLTRNYSTPVYTGGPHTIWGLTAYLLEKFLKDVVIKCSKSPTSL